MVYTKKGISPVVATALLLVVPVVAVVGFQSWFTTYQSGVNTKVEQRSASGSALTIERLEVNGTNPVVYVKSTDTDDIEVTSWKVTTDGVGVCTGGTFTATASSVSQATASSCTPSLNVSQAYDVVVVSASGVYTATAIAR